MPRPSRRIVSGQGSAPERASPSAFGSGPSSQPASRSVSASSSGSASSAAGVSGYDLSSSTSSLTSSSSAIQRGGNGNGNGNGSPAASPAKIDRSISQYEVMYNTAVQAFVRRDHGKAQETLGKLLDMLSKERAQIKTGTLTLTPQSPWWDLAVSPATAQPASGTTPTTALDEWTIRALKLLISSLASLYSDPSPLSSSSRLTALPEAISALLSPTPADRLLTYLHAQCVTHAIPPPLLNADGSRQAYNPASSLLPPALLSTLLLAALKIPGEASVKWAHGLAEDWIAGLPDSFFGAISPSGGLASRQRQGQGQSGAGAGTDVVRQNKVDSAREGYIKVVELFVGEVLVREGEWEMARAFLEGESVIGSKRKENLYKHIRSAERAKQMTPPTSSALSTPDNSLILPSPTASGTIRPSHSSSARSRHPHHRSRRTSSAASSESEATARPNADVLGSASQYGYGTGSRISSGPTSPMASRGPRASTSNAAPGMGLGMPSSSSFLHPTQSGKDRVSGGGDDRSVSESTRSTLPSRIFVNPFPSLSRSSPLGATSPQYPYGKVGSGRGGSPSPDDDRPAGWAALIAFLPRSLRARVEPILRSPWLLALILGIPTILGSVVGAMIVRKLFRRYIARLRSKGRTQMQTQVLGVSTQASPAGIGGAIAPASASAARSSSSKRTGDLVVSDLKERMKRQREGWMRWVRGLVGWWLSKLWGVWEMGTTITYV